MQNRVRWVVKPRKCNSNSTSGSARIWTAWEESCPAATQDWEALVQTGEGALPFFHFFHFPPHLLHSIRCRERMMIYSKLQHGRIVVQGCRRSTTCWQQKWSDISGFEHFWRCPTTPCNCLPRMLVTWRLGAHRNGASIRQGLSSPKKQLLHRGLGKCYEGQGLETLNTFKQIPWYWALLEQTPTDTQFFNDLATYWGRSTELEHRWMWKGVSAPQNKKLITSHRPVGRSCRRPWPSKPLWLRFFGFLWAKPLFCETSPDWPASRARAPQPAARHAIEVWHTAEKRDLTQISMLYLDTFNIFISFPHHIHAQHPWAVYVEVGPEGWCVRSSGMIGWLALAESLWFCKLHQVIKCQVFKCQVMLRKASNRRLASRAIVPVFFLFCFASSDSFITKRRWHPRLRLNRLQSQMTQKAQAQDRHSTAHSYKDYGMTEWQSKRSLKFACF